MKQVFVSLLILGFLAGCGTLGNSANSSAGSASSAGSGASSGSARSSGSGLFGGRRVEVEQKVDIRTQAAGGRRLMSVVREARFDRTRDGGIIRATGVAPRQGYYDAVLFSPTGFKPNEKGTIVLEFRAREPQFVTATSTERSRMITVGLFLSDQKLAAAKRIVVVGGKNQIAISRR